ncbi:MAG: SO_0444 family Cu/Zn efflux transporter [Candidatus Sumerlaeia bacterium]|nr:SO_0444 family Cu/Zn efflux transporter [Candidatus Sumerlaeia bacterium]
MSQILQSIGMEFWAMVAEVSPYLLLGFFFAGLLSVLVSPSAVGRHLGGRGIVPVAKAALFGVPLPLCSCGVIPLAASLRSRGASRGATTAFLLSTPQTGVDSIFITYSLLGLTVAILRPIAAFLTGLLGGWLVGIFVSDNEREESKATDSPAAACSLPENSGKLRRLWDYGFVDLPRDIGRPLIIGLILAGIIAAAIPADYFAGLRGTGLWPKLVMLGVGIPIYVCATGSVPIAAALVHQGVSPGAALVFLISGPATNMATLAVIIKTMGKKTLGIYLATVAFCALASGVLLDFWLTSLPHPMTTHGEHAMMPLWMSNLFAFAMIAILAHALLRPYVRRERRRPAEIADSEMAVSLRIEGMTCSHCAQTVREALTGCAGVRAAEIDLAGGQARIVGKGFDIAALRRAVELAGYSASPINHSIIKGENPWS